MSEEVKAIRCPGWTGIEGTHVNCGGTRGLSKNANLLAWDPDRSVQKEIDGKNVRSLEPGYPDMCLRCAKQKTKYDEEHGLREQREQGLRDRKESLIAAYVGDVRAAHEGEPFDFAVVLTAVNDLEERGNFPPHPKVSEEGYRRSWSTIKHFPTDAEKLNILRALAGLPVEHKT